MKKITESQRVSLEVALQNIQEDKDVVIITETLRKMGFQVGNDSDALKLAWELVGELTIEQAN